MRKQKQSKTFVISYELYPFDVMVTTAELSQIVKQNAARGYQLSDEEKQLLEMEGDGRTVMLDGRQTIIRLKREPVCPETIAFMVHEVFHAVEILFDRIGLSLCRQSAEAYAYAIQYLTQEILFQFKAKRKRVR